MPPKKANATQHKEDEDLCLPPRLTAQDIQADWEDTTSGEYFCRVIVNRVVAEMEDEIVRAHMDHTAVPWTIQSVLTDLMESVQLNFIERERGEVTEADPADVEISISEPPVTDPDSWARASMLQRSALVRADAEQFATKTVVKERRPVMTRVTSDLPVSGSSNPLTGQGQGVTSLAASRGGSGNSSSHAVGRLRRGSVTHGGSVAGSEVDVLDSMLRTDEEVKQMERQKAAAERMTHLRSVADRLNKQFSEIRNVNQVALVVDGKTNTVLQVNRPDPRKLPHTAEPRIKLEQDREELEAAAAAAALEKDAQGAGRGSRNTSYPRPDDKKGKPRKPDSGNFFVPELATNPMVQGVQPSAGVSSKEGDSIKRSEFKTQKSKITRQEFSKVMAMQRQTQNFNTGIDGLETGGLEGMSGSAPMMKPGIKRTDSNMASINPTASQKSLVKSTLSSGVVAGGGRQAKVVSTNKQVDKQEVTVHKPPKKTLGKRPASTEHNPKHRSPLRRREGEIPTTLPVNDAGDRAMSPSKAGRLDPTHIPRPNEGHAPLSEITLRARASTPDLLKMKEKVISHRTQPSVMRLAQQEGGEPGEVSDLAAEFFSDLVNPYESSFN